MLAGAGGNIAVQIGDEGVLLVDTGLAASAPRMHGRNPQAVGRPDPLHHQHAPPSGSQAAATKPSPRLAPRRHWRAAQDHRAREHAQPLDRRRKRRRRRPNTAGAARTTKYFTPHQGRCHFNGEAVVLYHEPKAHTDGDTRRAVPRLRRRRHRRHLHARRLSLHRHRQRRQRQGRDRRAQSHPAARPCRSRRRKAARTSFPATAASATKPTSSSSATWWSIVRDRIQDMINKRMTLDQVKAGQTHARLRHAYVTPTSFVTTDRFVEAIYKSLSQASARREVRRLRPLRQRGQTPGNRGQAPAGRR